VEAALAGLADRLPLKGTGFCVENRRGAEEDTEIYYLTAETRRSQRLIIVLSYRRGAEEDTEIYYLTAETRRSQRLIIVLSYRRGAEFPEGARWRKERIIFRAERHVSKIFTPSWSKNKIIDYNASLCPLRLCGEIIISVCDLCVSA
jgi:hypothetical protein